MAFAQQMRIELINIRACFGADVTLPRVRLAVAAFVQKVECLVGELDAAVGAAELLLRSIGAGVVLGAGRRDRAVRGGRRGGI